MKIHEEIEQALVTVAKVKKKSVTRMALHFWHHAELFRILFQIQIVKSCQT